MKKSLAFLALGVALLGAPWVAAQVSAADGTDIQALRKVVTADKRALVASTLALTPAEARKFWPIYDDYQRQLVMIVRRRALAVEELIAQDKPVSDLHAKILANEWIAIDEADIKARRSLQGKLMRALPPKKAARYLQLELKIDAIAAYDIASSIPLIK